jgi:predicted CxxxxCH...CXXCH cytochrome family protein
VDPAAAGPSGFYWLDTTGDYHLPSCSVWPCPAGESGGDPARLTNPLYLYYQCTACHDGTKAPVGGGKVLPLRHVNGKRDVVFDPRTTLPAIAWLPAAPNVPTRPYWVTNANPMVTIPDPSIPDAVMDGATLSLHLQSARYDPATKTCTSVACHLAQTTVVWGAPHGNVACGPCHGF